MQIIRQACLVLCFCSLLHAGTIDSGTITIDGRGRIGSVDLFGSDFQVNASGVSDQVGQPPGLFPPGLGGILSGAQLQGGVTFGGVEYATPPSGPFGPFPDEITDFVLTFGGDIGFPVTGPGDYPITLSVNILFCLAASPNVPICEGGSGLVNAVFTYADQQPNGYVLLQPLDLTDFIPEPSACSLVAIGLLGIGSRWRLRGTQN